MHRAAPLRSARVGERAEPGVGFGDWERAMILFVVAVILAVINFKLIRYFYIHYKVPFDKHTMEIRNEYGVIMFDSWEDHIKYKKWSAKIEISEKILGIILGSSILGVSVCAAFQALGVRPN